MLSPSLVILSGALHRPVRGGAKNLLFPGLTVRLRSPSLSKVEGRVSSAENLGIWLRVNTAKHFALF